MMRLLTAALVEVGAGAMSLNDFGRAVSHGDRHALKSAAPAKGLCLMEVGYDLGNPFGKSARSEESANDLILPHNALEP